MSPGNSCTTDRPLRCHESWQVGFDSRATDGRGVRDAENKDHGADCRGPCGAGDRTERLPAILSRLRYSHSGSTVGDGTNGREVRLPTITARQSCRLSRKASRHRCVKMLPARRKCCEPCLTLLVAYLYVYEEFRDKIEVTSERMVDKIDPVRFFPVVGPAQLHHCHWKCTIYYTETSNRDIHSQSRSSSREWKSSISTRITCISTLATTRPSRMSSLVS